MIKIAYITDLHSRRSTLKKVIEEIRKTDVEYFVLGGDITDFGSFTEFKSIINYVEEEFDGKSFFVPGNCDPIEALEWEGSNNSRNIHARPVKISDYDLVGLGGSNFTPFDTPIEFAEEEIKAWLEKFSRLNNLILVSHVPPFGTRLDRIYSGRHVGSRSLRSFIEDSKPLIVLTGHIHEARGADKIGDTVVINPGPGEYGNYAIITLDPSGVDYELKKID